MSELRVCRDCGTTLFNNGECATLACWIIRTEEAPRLESSEGRPRPENDPDGSLDGNLPTEKPHSVES